MDTKGAKRSVKMWITNFHKSFFKNILLYMNGRLSKTRSVHKYVIPRTVYFDWICTKGEEFNQMKVFRWSNVTLIYKVKYGLNYMTENSFTSIAAVASMLLSAISNSCSWETILFNGPGLLVSDSGELGIPCSIFIQL